WLDGGGAKTSQREHEPTWSRAVPGECGILRRPDMAVPAQSPGSARAPIAVTLDDVRTLEIHPAGDATILRVRSATPGDRIELELRFTAEGPVVRTRAAALELEAADS